MKDVASEIFAAATEPEQLRDLHMELKVKQPTLAPNG
jgi:hypothetical protein